MKKVFESEDAFAVTQLRETLQRQGIPCVIKNDPVRTPPPEIPVVRGSSELWVEKDSDASRAEELIRALEKAPEKGSSWKCPNCGVTVEPQFAACWKCGTQKP